MSKKETVQNLPTLISYTQKIPNPPPPKPRHWLVCEIYTTFRFRMSGQLSMSRSGAVGAGCAVRRPLPALPFRKRVATVPSVVSRAESGDEKAASTVVGSSEDEPVWVKREKQRELDAQSKDLPFGLYLLFSCFVTIAAVGSIFEWSAQNPIFGVIEPDSALYTPILGLFAVTGIPTAGVLFFKGVSAANAEAERMDAQDGYTPRPNVLNPKRDE